jgi:excisionase family DNA binding protein
MEATTKTAFGNALAITVKETAEALRCSPSKVYNLIDRNQLQAIRLSDGPRAHRRVLVGSLTSFLESGPKVPGSSKSWRED